jgi:hypothetical protein
MHEALLTWHLPSGQFAWLHGGKVLHAAKA